MATLRLGDIAPDLTQDSTEGPIEFHKWLGDKWGVLFSHPKDFTPVCTTELGYTAKLKPEFDKRGVKVLAHRIDNLERGQMRTLVDQLRDKVGSGVVVLGSASNGNVSLIVGVTKDLTGRIQAGKVIGPVAQKVGGKGGGRPDLAEAGGKDAAALDSALAEVYTVVDSLLGS